MNISVLCSDPIHPVVSRLQGWSQEMRRAGYVVSIFFSKQQLVGGDILFLVSCAQIIDDEVRRKFSVALVLHASDLPNGRGWSPYVWAVLNGESKITVTLLEASDPVDSGRVWLKSGFLLDGHELLPEIHTKLFNVELQLMTEAVLKCGEINPIPQPTLEGSYYRKRTPSDSRLDPEKTIAEQFDLLRVVDSERYPAFLDYRGHRYLINIEKANHDKLC